MLLLSVRAGLRACEVAGLESGRWCSTSAGKWAVRSKFAMGLPSVGAAGWCRAHPELRSRASDAEATPSPGLWDRSRETARGALHQGANSIVNWFGELYRSLLARSAARRTAAEGLGSRRPRLARTRWARAYATCSCSPGTDRSRRRQSYIESFGRSAASARGPALAGREQTACAPQSTTAMDLVVIALDEAEGVERRSSFTGSTSESG